MYLRTCAIACTLLALLAAPHRPAARSWVPLRAVDVVQSGHEEPLPFLGSGGVVVQVPATQPTPPLRAATTARLPSLACPKQWRGRRAGALPVRDLAASIRACRLGTPPPFPRSGRAEGPVHPVQA